MQDVDSSTQIRSKLASTADLVGSVHKSADLITGYDTSLALVRLVHCLYTTIYYVTNRAITAIFHNPFCDASFL